MSELYNKNPIPDPSDVPSVVSPWDTARSVDMILDSRDSRVAAERAIDAAKQRGRWQAISRGFASALQYEVALDMAVGTDSVAQIIDSLQLANAGYIPSWAMPENGMR